MLTQAPLEQTEKDWPSAEHFMPSPEHVEDPASAPGTAGADETFGRVVEVVDEGAPVDEPLLRPRARLALEEEGTGLLEGAGAPDGVAVVRVALLDLVARPRESVTSGGVGCELV